MSQRDESKVCGAFIKKKGKRCQQPKGWGTDHPGSGHCKIHFGSTPRGKEYAAKEAGLELLKYTKPIKKDPIGAIMEELHRTAGQVAWLDDKISHWNLDADDEIPEYQKQWLSVHRMERKHMVAVAECALRAGVAEREIRLAEQQGALLADAIEKILSELDLTAVQVSRIPEIVPRVLHAVSARVKELPGV